MLRKNSVGVLRRSRTEGLGQTQCVSSFQSSTGENVSEGRCGKILGKRRNRCYRARVIKRKWWREGRVWSPGNGQKAEGAREGKRGRLADPRGHVGLANRRPSTGGDEGWTGEQCWRPGLQAWRESFSTTFRENPMSFLWDSESVCSFLLEDGEWEGQNTGRHPREGDCSPSALLLNTGGNIKRWSDAPCTLFCSVTEDGRTVASERWGRKPSLCDCSPFSPFPQAQGWHPATALLSPLGQPEAVSFSLQQRFRTFKNLRIQYKTEFEFPCVSILSFVETKQQPLDWNSLGLLRPSGNTSAAPWGPRRRDYGPMMTKSRRLPHHLRESSKGPGSILYFSDNPQPLTKSSRAQSRWSMTSEQLNLVSSQENKA